MPLQSRAAQGFAGAAVEVDLIHKGIMTLVCIDCILTNIILWK